jgi:hypothetical protein
VPVAPAGFDDDWAIVDVLRLTKGLLLPQAPSAEQAITTAMNRCGEGRIWATLCSEKRVGR